MKIYELIIQRKIYHFVKIEDALAVLKEQIQKNNVSATQLGFDLCSIEVGEYTYI